MFDTHLAQQSIGPLLQGLLRTIEYTLIVIVLSLVAGIPVALAKISGGRLLRALINLYIELFRTTPLLIQLVFIYFALPPLGITLSPFAAGVIGLALHYTAFIAEVYRSGIQAVPKGQRDAARALGMHSRTMMRRVVLPQAIRIVVPALGNYFISLIKDTSLLSVITVQELLFSGQLIAARTFDYFTIYSMVFAIYFVVGYAAVLLVRWVERRVERRRTVIRGAVAVPGPAGDGAPVGGPVL